jgi:hypothetical protein
MRQVLDLMRGKAAENTEAIKDIKEAIVGIHLQLSSITTELSNIKKGQGKVYCLSTPAFNAAEKKRHHLSDKQLEL